MQHNTDTEAGQIAALAVAAEAAKPFIISGPGGRSFLALPEGFSHVDVTPANAGTTSKPDHIKQSVTLQTAESLGDYLARFKTADTALFADIAGNKIVGAIDYHGASAAALVAHRATLNLPFSVEWALWTSIDGKHLSQLDFARFLEENADDITNPVAADLLELVRDLQAVVTENTQATVRTNSDNVDFTFAASTDARSGGGRFELPKSFGLSIPVYFDEAPVPIEARLRWKKDQTGLTFGVMLLRKEQVRQGEFKRVVAQVATKADLPVVYGAF